MKKTSGMSIVGVLVSVVVLAILSIVLVQVVTHQKIGEAQLDRRIDGEQVLVDTVVYLQNLDFDLLWNYCGSKGATPGPVKGLCTAAGQLNPNLIYAPTILSSPSNTLEVLKDWNGIPITPTIKAQTCVELTQCDLRAEGHLMEMTLTGYWLSPQSNAGLTTRTISFRKTRW